MTLPSEWEIIRRIKTLCNEQPTPGALITGIGDDCAVFETAPGRYGLITADISIQNVHFRLDYCTPEEIGHKAMTGNISDIAAMGGMPLLAFVSLGIPGGFDPGDVESLYRGMIKAAGPAGPKIAGGDTSSSESLVISIAVYGEAGPEKPVMRNGACAGDTICLTGNVGGSLAGLEILAGKRRHNGAFADLVSRHVSPRHRLDCAPEILGRFSPAAMIDVSDGLLSDLRHLCEASGTGFLLNGENIPLPAGLDRYASVMGRDPLDYALHSGEEFELLFTSKAAFTEPAKLENGVMVTPVGFVTQGGFMLSYRGEKKEIEIVGYDHFK